MKEIWKDIEGYEGLYQVSNLGRVKSLDRLVKTNINNVEERLFRGKELSYDIGKNGYVYVCLFLNGKGKRKSIHRIVAEAFIPNPDNKPQVNHINTIRADNRVENLEWCTHTENMNNPLTKDKLSNCKIGRKQSEETIEKRVSKIRGKERSVEVRKKIAESNYKPIIQLSKDGKLIKIWGSIKEAKAELGITSIADCLSGRQKTAGGYKFIYKT